MNARNTNEESRARHERWWLRSEEMPERECTRCARAGIVVFEARLFCGECFLLACGAKLGLAPRLVR